MKDHPTPQRSGRTADEILKSYISRHANKFLGRGTPIDAVRIREDTLRQLFDAICSEVIGEDAAPATNFNSQQSAYWEKDAFNNQLRAELRQKLRLFFGQAEESGKNGGR